jgi:hypothetical protein
MMGGAIFHFCFSAPIAQICDNEPKKYRLSMHSHYIHGISQDHAKDMFSKVMGNIDVLH